MKIPSSGRSKEAVFAALAAARAHDFPWREGRLYAYVFDGGPEIEEVGKQAYLAYLTENAIDPTAFPSLLGFENDLVAMARDHLGGGAQVVGNFTSGGTESIILAVKTARDAFRAKNPARPAAERPQMLVPITAHAAFHKAAHYLGVELIGTPVDPETFCADVAAMRAAITERTMLLVASACSYAHGVVDPVRAIAGLAREKGLFCHVDGCMGGFLLPYFRRLGAVVPDFDFRVPGVTSMSMDLHKYALTPKGASLVLYENEALRRHQIFACSEWTGYTMINNTIQSSKSGGPIAAAWAVLQFVGDDGYLAIARRLLDAKNAIVAGVNAIPGLRVLGAPEMSLVAFSTVPRHAGDAPLSPFALCDEMKARGFHVQPQLAFGPSPANVHVTVAPSNVQHTEAFLAELRAATDAVRAAGGGPKPPIELAAMLAQQLSADTTGEGLSNLIAALGGGPGGEVPAKMADVNALLDALPNPLREKLLVAFVGRMFTPRGD